MATSKEELKFEEALEQLQAVVKKLESGELPLDQSLKQFEEGVRLTQFCQKHLAQAEQKVELLMKSQKEDGGSVTSASDLQDFEQVPFNPN